MLSELTISTGSGAWNPLVLVLAAASMTALSYVVYALGEKKYKVGSAQTLPFLSGNAAEEEELHVGASNLYWGFTTALEKYYYGFALRMHTGIVTDQFTYFIAALAVLLAIIVFGAT